MRCCRRSGRYGGVTLAKNLPDDVTIISGSEGLLMVKVSPIPRPSTSTWGSWRLVRSRTGVSCSPGLARSCRQTSYPVIIGASPIQDDQIRASASVAAAIPEGPFWEAVRTGACRSRIVPAEVRRSRSSSIQRVVAGGNCRGGLALTEGMAAIPHGTSARRSSHQLS